MKKTDVVVIGGSAAGIVAATTGKAFYPDKDFLLIRKEQKVLVPCGIPYSFGTLEGNDQNIIADGILEKGNVKLQIGEVISIDQENKYCTINDGEKISYDKLVLALGSIPVVPKKLEGIHLDNVFTIPKDKIYLDKIREKLEGLSEIFVVGGGFIGVEMADELNKTGKNITLVEILPHILGLAFDDELALKAEEHLQSRGVTLKTNVGVKEIQGDESVSQVILTNGETHKADAVILSTGYRPNTILAKDTGLVINEKGFIKVNEYLMTSHADIFAVGDCAEKSSFLTRTLKGTMLASTACAEARIAGMNLFKLSALRSFGGTISIFCTAIGETGFGVAGVNEKLAKERGFDVISGRFEGIDKHPGTLPDTHKQIVKLIASRESGTIIGGEVIGGISTGELTNLIGIIVENQMTSISLLTSQIGTHPFLTAPPTAYPLIKAAEIVERKRRNVM
jgi:NADH oxidase (H2O2-forming)